MKIRSMAGMMSRIAYCAVLGLAMVSCYDDSALWGAINDHEGRILQLELICQKMNTDISALQTIVEALQKNDYVKEIAPIKLDGETIGYTISFEKSGSITIYTGKDGVDGEDGKTPIVSVKQDDDENYYWTLNGEWLLDENGEKVKASGKDGEDGEDGLTPAFKIVNGEWYVSYDGINYTKVGDAYGNCTSCISVSYDENYVYLTLQDGTVLTLNRVHDDIEEEEEGEQNLSKNGTANCYLVPCGGTYRFNAMVKGNSQESVGHPTSVEVLWETFNTSEKPQPGDIIKDAQLSNDGYVVFTTADNYTKGNALIAVKDENGIILWSWHLWVTDYDPGNDYDIYAGNDDTPVMDRNLGATNAEVGDVGALGLLYEWGRKDPFLNSCDINYATEAASTIEFPESVGCSEETGTIEYATQNPTTYIYWGSNFDWVCDLEIENTRWSPSKTMYDPCPAGWRIPDGEFATSVWAGLPLGQTSYWNDENKGILIPPPYSNNETWYPAGGRRDWSGDLNYIGRCGDYWTCSPCYIEGYTYEALVFDFGYDGIINLGNVAHTDDGTGFHRADALSVRCCKE